jgi:hypothetical protein
MFASGEPLNHLVGDSTLDEALESLGLGVILVLLRIELEHEAKRVDFLGWSSSGDEDSHFTLILDIPWTIPPIFG